MRDIFQNIFDRLGEIAERINRMILDFVPIDERNDVPVDPQVDQGLPRAPIPPDPRPIAPPQPRVERPGNRPLWDLFDLQRNLGGNRARPRSTPQANRDLSELPVGSPPLSGPAPQRGSISNELMRMLDAVVETTTGRNNDKNKVEAAIPQSQNPIVNFDQATAPPQSAQRGTTSALQDGSLRTPPEHNDTRDPVTRFFFPDR